jgi:preprotein translocase subunit SecG
MGDKTRVVAGILGGSGSHVVQIIIVIVVAIVLITYFLLRVGGRGGSDIRAAAEAVRERNREKSTSDATVVLARRWTGMSLGARSAPWDIAIDGAVVGSIATKETVEVAVEPGHHTLRLGGGRHRSAERSFDVAPGEVVAFSCNGPRIWPQLLAALVKPDLWISLRRE